MRSYKEIVEKADKYLITSMLTKMQPIAIAEAKGSTVKDVTGY